MLPSTGSTCSQGLTGSLTCLAHGGMSTDYSHHCHLEFGDYVQTHEQHDNSMNLRTIGAIALCQTGNAQGGYFFLSLTTGKVINCLHWTSLPMPNEVID